MISCKVDGCKRNIHCKNYCIRHYQQMLRYGKIFERTRYDKPNIRIENNIAYISTYDKNETSYSEVIIDIDDIIRVEKYRLNIDHKGYAANKKIGLLHRFIIGANSGQFVDHINRNKLDNRKVNLRIVTRSENVHNSKIHVTNTSGIKGVYFHKATGKWEAFINKDGKIYRKLFTDIEDAKRYRKELECESYDRISKEH